MIHYMSDIHLEFSQWPKHCDLASIDCDVHVLAGDIGTGLLGIEFALTLNRPVIMVAGNHELFSKRTVDEFWNEARKRTAGTHVHLLENNSVTIGDTKFLGCTLWTDFCVMGADQQDKMMAYARERMSDYSKILLGHHRAAPSEKGTRITPQWTLDKHLASREYLEHELNARTPGIKTVVVTHHAPHPKSLPYGEAVSRTDAAYASDLSDLVAKADLWINGHVHEARDYTLETGGRVVCNCRGYKDTGIDAVEGFAWDRVIEL